MGQGVLFCSDEFVEFVSGDAEPEEFAGFTGNGDNLQVFVSPQAMLGPTVMTILERSYGDALHFPQIWIL